MKPNLLVTALIIILVTFSACKKNEVFSTQYGLNSETEKDLINRALRIDGLLIEEEMPQPTVTGNLIITSHPSAVQVSAGVLLFIPYATNSNDTLCKLYLQVEDADSYWDVQIHIDSSSGNPYIQILIPNFVQDGDFNILYAAGDCNGNISEWVSTNTIVTPPLTCGGMVSGSVGITVTHYDLGDKPGIVSVSYNMYTIPDRIDLLRNNEWIASSGTGLSNSQLGPNCSLDGFVSSTHVLTFNYDPDDGGDLFVYVTGCDNSTAWDVEVDCPQ